MAFAGTFSDGKTAVRHDVAVAVTGHDVLISGETVGLLHWPFDDLRVIESDAAASALRLTRRSDDEPRLLVPDPAFRDTLLEILPELDPDRGSSRRTLALVAGALAGIAMFGATLWFGLPVMAKPVAAMVPQSVEDRIGSRVLDLAIGARNVCESRAGEAALDRLVERVLAGVGQPVDLNVQVVDNPMVNAIAAPGGNIVIFSGLLKKVESADEVAGVLAHEIGHVVHRHGMQALVRHFALTFVVTVFTGSDWGLGSAAQLLVQFAYSREAETEADATGVGMLERAGLRADGLATFFARLAKDEGRDSLLRYAGTHPPTAERQAATARDRSGDPALTDAEWAALREICRKD